MLYLMMRVYQNYQQFFPGFALDIDREFYTEESAYLKLQITSQTKQFAAWDQECRGETNSMNTK